MRAILFILALFVGPGLVGAGPATAGDGAGNRLADSTSPYLALHVKDPVHWRVWGKEALAEARRAWAGRPAGRRTWC